MAHKKFSSSISITLYKLSTTNSPLLHSLSTTEKAYFVIRYLYLPLIARFFISLANYLYIISHRRPLISHYFIPSTPSTNLFICNLPAIAHLQLPTAGISFIHQLYLLLIVHYFLSTIYHQWHISLSAIQY